MTQERQGKNLGGQSALRRVEVALAESGRLPSSLTYAVPSDLDESARPGACVTVPLGSRRVTGIVLGPSTGDAPRGLRPLAAVVHGVRVPQDLLDLNLLLLGQSGKGEWLGPDVRVADQSMPVAEQRAVTDAQM